MYVEKVFDKMNFPRILISFLLLSSIIVIGCSASLPAGGDAEEYMEERMESESKGRIVLIDFNKLNGIEKKHNGMDYYVLEFKMVMEFQEDCRWVTGHLGKFKGFETKKVKDIQGGLAGWQNAFANPGTDVKKGLRARLYGSIVYEKTENGWRVAQVEVKKMEKLTK
ncbi:MAG: hypothetical protein KZQ99_03495 [Candidatus Thiodiazotropha sp. (ex Dulcina madagascariensis)]|nr:hypothetical protein [Candidatus Thiodiazotropha sp. (ex Dulcina madagascariensis)]